LPPQEIHVRGGARQGLEVNVGRARRQCGIRLRHQLCIKRSGMPIGVFQADSMHGGLRRPCHVHDFGAKLADVTTCCSPPASVPRVNTDELGRQIATPAEVCRVLQQRRLPACCPTALGLSRAMPSASRTLQGSRNNRFAHELTARNNFWPYARQFASELCDTWPSISDNRCSMPVQPQSA
jgi:hypothetical protein